MAGDRTGNDSTVSSVRAGWTSPSAAVIGVIGATGIVHVDAYMGLFAPHGEPAGWPAHRGGCREPRPAGPDRLLSTLRNPATG